MTRVILICAAMAMAISIALAQSDPITERKNLMKSNGAATRTGTQMVKGEVPFDAARANEIFANYQRVGSEFPQHFPENTKSGDTKASPKIWEDMPGFRTIAAKLVTDAKEAAASTKDFESFKAGFTKATANCRACHDNYRINP
jgi:cytochrome c556